MPRIASAKVQYTSGLYGLPKFRQLVIATGLAPVDALFARLEATFEQVDGLSNELGRALRWHADVDTGPNLPVDELLAAVDPGAHLTDDLFTSKVAFVALLNFPLTTLDQRLRDAAGYSRQQ